jgi:Flp pilus assembly protein TadD
MLVDAFEAEVGGGVQAIRQALRAESGDGPSDPETLALLIKTTIAADDLVEAKLLVAYSQQIIAADHPEIIGARGLYALRTGNYELAQHLFEDAKKRLPLDSGIRMGLVETLRARGLDDEAENEIRDLRAIGIRAGSRAV